MTKFRVGSKYKPLVMSTRYKKSPYTARTILHPKTTLRNATLAQVNRLVKREVHLICSRKHGDSVLRLSDMNAVKKFSWGTILRELRLESPTLYSFLRAVLFKHKHRVHHRSVGMCASLLLKSRNKHLGLVQGVISLLMYAGHSSKQVCLCHSGVCVINIHLGFSPTQQDWHLPQSP